MTEILGSSGRIPVDQFREIPGEIPPPETGRIAVACLVNPNTPQFDYRARASAEFNARKVGQRLRFAIAVKSDPPIQIIAPGTGVYGGHMAQQSMNRERDVRDGTAKVLKKQPFDLLYDLLATYDFSNLIDLDVAQTIALYQPYFEAIHDQLMPGGHFLIQLDEMNPQYSEAFVKRMKDHNLGIEIALTRAGFDLNNCRRVPYEMSNKDIYTGVKGTLLIFEKEGNAEGEDIPNTDTSEGQPQSPPELNVKAVLAEAERLLTEIVPARR